LRLLEIDPTTLEIVWQYTPREAGLVQPLDASRFYGPFIRGAQRLPNGNTLITEGSIPAGPAARKAGRGRSDEEGSEDISACRAPRLLNETATSKSTACVDRTSIRHSA
jgi:hypothetical protein